MTSSDLTPTDAAVVETPKNPCEREVSVEIPAETVTKEWKETLARFQKHARLPGFRAGKVPATLVSSKFEQEIKSEIIEHLLPPAFRAETAKQNLLPVGQPAVYELVLEEDKPLTFKAKFEVLPEFSVDGYQDIRVAQDAYAVSDEEVEKALDNLREQSATYENVDEDRALADGDFASVSFTSTSPEEGAEPVEMKEVLAEIGGSNTVKDISDNLRGGKAGETKSFDVTYAEDFGDKRLAGKTLHYDVEIKGIKHKVKPELNDEWVKDLGQEDLTTLDELRKRIREGMEHEKKHQAEHAMKDEAVKQLLEKFPIPVPTVLVENAIDQRLEHGLRSLVQQGIQAEMLKRMDLSKMREAQRPSAENDVRCNLLLEKIADAAQVEVGDDELDREILASAARMGQPAAALRKQLEERNGLEHLRTQLRCDRALDVLIKQGV